MSRKLDNEILERLKDEVLKKDRELEEREVHNSTKEALAEMTSLSRAEVDKMYKKLSADAHAQQRKRNTIFAIIIGVLLIAGLILVKKLMFPPPPARSFTEEFNDTENGWDIFNQYQLNARIEDGFYKFETFEKTGYLRNDPYSVDLPANYNITVKTQWKKGSKSDNYGIQIGGAGTNFGYFYIRQNKTARYGFRINKQWASNITEKECPTFKQGEKSFNTIKVAVRGEKFKFYVNNELLYFGHMEILKAHSIKLVCGGTQEVYFDYIRISEPGKSKPIFEDKFDTPLKGWNPKIELEKKSKVENTFLQQIPMAIATGQT